MDICCIATEQQQCISIWKYFNVIKCILIATEKLWKNPEINLGFQNITRPKPLILLKSNPPTTIHYQRPKCTRTSEKEAIFCFKVTLCLSFNVLIPICCCFLILQRVSTQAGPVLNLPPNREKETGVLCLKHTTMAYIRKCGHTEMYLHFKQNVNRQIMVCNS